MEGTADPHQNVKIRSRRWSDMSDVEKCRVIDQEGSSGCENMSGDLIKNYEWSSRKMLQ